MKNELLTIKQEAETKKMKEFEKTLIPFNGAEAKLIKANIKRQIGRLQGSKENLDGFQRALFLLIAPKLTGLELKRLKNYIDLLPRDESGIVTDPAYYLIGGDILHSFIIREIEGIRKRINKAKENQEEMGKEFRLDEQVKYYKDYWAKQK